MLGNIGLPELLVILVLALVFFGPGRLPAVGSELGKAVRGFMDAFSGRGGPVCSRRSGKGRGGRRRASRR